MSVGEMVRRLFGVQARQETRQVERRKVERTKERAFRVIRAKLVLAEEFRAAGLPEAAQKMEAEAEEVRRNTAEARLMDSLGIRSGPNGSSSGSPNGGGR
jgi:hypothetical protein